MQRVLPKPALAAVLSALRASEPVWSFVRKRVCVCDERACLQLLDGARRYNAFKDLFKEHLKGVIDSQSSDGDEEFVVTKEHIEAFMDNLRSSGQLRS